MRSERGMTFAELMVASVIAAAVAGGTLSAMVTAARLSLVKASPQIGEATAYSQQAIEPPRNHVAWDDFWLLLPADGGIGDGTWLDVSLPPPTSSESILQPPGAERRRCVMPVDEDGDNQTDYYQVQVRVCWDGTACPAVGSGGGTCQP